eukprot:CAMPEP_0170441350 /NCGR_PEP_ID=MMETSP0117_2-20130122/46848_1 /TAXON_ID=400756 /ORGANISM="Durinskia baltica, Strain CSIRO CS-38" /LENGTH=1297 /DNA_ID=CAMNT_0010701887 /DNA_START=433 /DNA_END=4327 /DNA_ORIENTATION=+
MDVDGTVVGATVENTPLWALQRQTRAALVRQYLTGNINSNMSNSINSSNSSSNTITLQQQLNSANIHPPIALGPTNYVSELLAYRSFYRNRKQSRRDVKAWEKEDRRRRLELEDKRKKRAVEYHKALLSHREDFFRFHKSRKFECSKAARAVKTQLENLDARKEKDEARAESRRLQALRENDMAAYASLVQDTKNGRLKFLLNETDSYIATINRMIQEQRVFTPGEAAAAAAAAESASAATSAGAETDDKGKLTEASKEYLRSTHRTVETVRQPAMMKGGQLKEYQLAGLSWLISLYNNNLNGILADEMGLGKTIQTISMVCYLMEYKQNNGPFLIVVPLSTLSNWVNEFNAGHHLIVVPLSTLSNWVNEFNRWAPDVLKVVYKGAPDERKQLFKDEVESGQFNVLLTTYEYIMKDKSSLRKLGWQFIIVDEGHRMKNAQSKFAQILGTVYQSRHRILLTGTPLQNDLPELWALLNFLLPTIFSSVDTFDQWFNKPFAAFRQQGAGAGVSSDDSAPAEISQEERLLIVHRLHEVLRPFVLRRVKSQVLDQLPDKVEKVLRCNLSGWQRKMYQSIVHKGLGARKGDAPVGGLNNAIMQMRKVCNHPYLFLRDYCVDEDLVRSSGKFALLDRMLPKLKAGGHRVLMFSQMVESMNFLEQFFLLRGYMFLRLDGNTSADERERRVAQFNLPDSQHFIFLLSTRAGGLGINLATADTVIIFDSDWNPMMDAQAQDRAHRIGQKKEVRVFRLLTNSPVEERILARATDKRNLNGLVVEAGQFNVRTPAASGSNNSAANAAAQAENRAMMESLLKEWSTGASMSLNDSGSGDGTGEEGAGTSAAGADQAEDDYVNEVMASSEAELAVYQALDVQYEKDRIERWKAMHANTGTAAPPLPPRLMEAQEKPLWMNEDCWPTKYAVIAKDMLSVTTTASGARSGMVAQATKKKGRRKNSDIAFELQQQQQYGVTGDAADDWGHYSDGDSQVSDAHIVAGKVMRKRKEVSYDDGMTDKQYARHIERQQDQMLAEQASAAVKADKAANTVFQALSAVVSSLQKIKREDGSQLAAIFLDKPPKAIYPDYYVIIAQPIALKQILQKLKKMEYAYFEDVEQDFALMSHNARIFNLDTSPVYSDCETLRREFYARSAIVLKKFDITPTEFTPLPPTSHHIYPADYSYRRPLSTMMTMADDGVGSDEEEDGESAAGGGKKGKAGAQRRKREAKEPGSAPAKKRPRMSSGSSSSQQLQHQLPYGGDVDGAGLSISLKKPRTSLALGELPTHTSLDGGEEREENQLYLSFSLKGRK